MTSTHDSPRKTAPAGNFFPLWQFCAVRGRADSFSLSVR